MNKSIITVIHQIVETSEFWIINYYLRSYKKAPHGGVFNFMHPNMFLKHYSTQIYRFFTPNTCLPLPVKNKISTLSDIFLTELDVEELCEFCFCIDKNDNYCGTALYIATCGQIFSLKQETDKPFDSLVYAAIDKTISFTDCFNININRLFELFICYLVEKNFYCIDDISEINQKERLLRCGRLGKKYGIADITGAEFKRHGYKYENLYFLYPLFFDTSIGSPISDIPETINILNKIDNPKDIYFRSDMLLSTEFFEGIDTASMDMQKWRGITITFDNIENILKSKKIIVHYDEETYNKILLYTKPDCKNGIPFIHFNVEQLWHPETISPNENFIITNYIHGTYYPSTNSFTHVGFSVNQYKTDNYIKKYEDSITTTGIPIDSYADKHCKIWCVEADKIEIKTWSELVCATLYGPFRKIFIETIGGTYMEDE